MPSRSSATTSKLPTALSSAAAGAVFGIFLARNFFATEKKIQQPIETDFGIADPQFFRTMSELLGPPLLAGNHLTLLRDGREIFAAMLDGIRSARRSITFENFYWKEGQMTYQFAEALADRAAAGVKVHFLQDAFGATGLHGPSLNLLRRSRVELEIYRWMRLSRFNLRTHRKLLVIDGQQGFIGGAGIADAWEGDADTPHHWHDTHYCVRGPAVAQIQRAFSDNWMQTRARVLYGEDYFPEISEAGNMFCQVFKSSANEGADSARMMFLLALSSARKSIQITNAYFIPDDLTVHTLRQAAQRGVAVEIITCGERIDQKVVRLVGRERWRPLLEAGVRIYEYQPKRLHCKYMILDDCWVSAGSANFDNRSFRLNDEANLNVMDATFAGEHARCFYEDRRASRQITLAQWKRRPLREILIARFAGLFRSQL